MDADIDQGLIVMPINERTFFMKRNIHIMYAIALLQGMVFYGPVATLYRQAHGISIFQITLIESISLILGIALEIPWGVIADRIGYRRTMVFCCGLYAVSKIIFWQATGFSGFLLERIMLSIIIAGLSGVDSSILYLSCNPENSRRGFGIYNALQMAGLLAAAAVFSLFIGENYELAGFLTVISYGAAALLSLGLTEVLPDKKKISDSPRYFGDILKNTLTNRYLLMFLLACAFLSETHQTITVFLNQLQYEKCGLSAAAIGGIYIFITLAGMIGAFSDKLTKSLHIRMSAILFYGVAILSCIILAATNKAIPSIAGILALRMAHSLFQPLQSEFQNRQVATAHRATELSIQAMIINSAAIATNLLFGKLAELSLPASFLFGAGICAAGIFLLLLWYRVYSKKEAV